MIIHILFAALAHFVVVGVAAERRMACAAGDEKFARFEGDDDGKDGLRPVELKRQNDETCEWWVHWPHRPSLCDGGANGFHYWRGRKI